MFFSVTPYFFFRSHLNKIISQQIAEIPIRFNYFSNPKSQHHDLQDKESHLLYLFRGSIHTILRSGTTR